MKRTPPSSAELSARRPLKSRSAAWAAVVAKVMLRVGLKPNQVSVLSGVFAGLALAAMLWPEPSGLSWLMAAVSIQLRLLCNLMDGMLAVEGGLKSATGDLFNEFPDRVADVLILVGLGYAGGTDWSSGLGWAVACGAVMTAGVRTHGASLVGSHDFRGPMAKPHRMALATLLCLIVAGRTAWGEPASLGEDVTWLLTSCLGVMLVGVGITLARRLRQLASTLQVRGSTEHGKSFHYVS